MGTGDWNDGMNLVGAAGKGESVWLGFFLITVLKRFAPIARARSDAAFAELCESEAVNLRERVEASAWDGDWYQRAWFDDGTRLGSAANVECRIDSIAQSWSVLSGAAPAERARTAMESLHRHLVHADTRIVQLLAPPFDTSKPSPGYIQGYVPGVRENGGQYTHAATWVAWAFAQLGDGNRAVELFDLLNPINHSDNVEKAEKYRVEPYVISADVYSVAPHIGRGGWTWYTGSAGWMYRLGIEAILGLKRHGDALEIDPCIPKEWDEYEMTYRDTETQYHIRVSNPQHVNRGVLRTTLDGNLVAGNCIPLAKDGGPHEVVIEMGTA